MHFSSMQVMKECLEEAAKSEHEEELREAVDQVIDGLSLMQNDYVLIKRDVIRETR